MRVRVRCKCGAVLIVGEEVAGHLGRCASCGRTMRIPRVLPRALDGVSSAEGYRATLNGELNVEGVPSGGEDEHVTNLMVMEWPASYGRTLTVIVAALIVAGGVIAALLLLQPSRPSKRVRPERRGGVSLHDPDSGFHITLPEGWQVLSRQGGVTTLVNGKLEARFVVTVGERKKLKEFAEEYNERAERLPGYKGGPEWERSADNFYPIEKYYSFRDADSGQEMWVLVRAISVGGRIFRFELTSGFEGWSGAQRDFLKAWKTVRVE